MVGRRVSCVNYIPIKDNNTVWFRLDHARDSQCIGILPIPSLIIHDGFPITLIDIEDRRVMRKLKINMWWMFDLIGMDHGHVCSTPEQLLSTTDILHLIHEG